MGEHMVIERYLWFDQQVRKWKYPNSASLVRQFAISMKTGQRHIERMRTMYDAPLAYDDAKRGYYYTDESFSFLQHQINQEELLAILLARSLLACSAGGLISKAIQSFGRRLFSATKRFGLTEAGIEESFSATWNGYSPANPNIFRITADALLKQKLLTFTYLSPLGPEPAKRRAEPHHLQHYMGTWMLLAWCRDRRDWRTFSLSRMEYPVAGPEYFTPRPGTDWRPYLADSFGIFQGGNPVNVLLRFNAFRTPWIKEQIWHPQQRMRHLPDGGLELTLPVADYREIKMKILQFGADVEVVEPADLREEVRREIGKMGKIY